MVFALPSRELSGLVTTSVSIMKTSFGKLAIGLLIAAVAGACAVSYRTVEKDALVGVWQVDEITLQSPGGSGTNTDPQPGLFIFTADHYSIAWIPRPEPRPAFAKAWKPTDEEIKSAYGTILFNAGTYELTDSTLRTEPLVSKVPDLSGGHAVYRYRLEKGTLWLTMIDEYAADGSRAPWVGKFSFPLKLTRIE